LGFVRLWQELLRRFATPTKPHLLLHKATAAIPNAAACKTRKFLIKKKLTKTGDIFKNVLTPHKPFYIYHIQVNNLKKKINFYKVLFRFDNV
jgi:hypothetical protein